MKTWFNLVLSGVLLIAVQGGASEPAREKYHVLSRDCKAFALVSSHDSVSDAYWAADKETARYPRDDLPEIRILVGSMRLTDELVGYEVWRNPCKDAWRLDSRCKTEQEVKAACARIRKERDGVLVIHRYQSKEK